MSHSFHQLYFHLIWATNNRDAVLGRTWRPKFLQLLNEEVKNRGGLPIRHNSMPDHVHLLVRLPPTVPVSDFIGKVKGATAFRVNHELKPPYKMHWQEGYGVVSIRRDEVDKVAKYIDRQEYHHEKGRLSDILECAWSDDKAKWPQGHALDGRPLKGPGVCAVAKPGPEGPG